MATNSATGAGTGMFRDLLRSLRGRPRVWKLADSSGVELSGVETLGRALALRSTLRRSILAPEERTVGLLLPPSVGGAVANLALALDRRVTVNLNYSLTPTILNDCAAQAGITHIITSRKVVERLSLNLDAEFVFLEDLAARVTAKDRAIAGFLAAVPPAALLLRHLGLERIADDGTMTVVFTSGTTGRPKGVELTYGNIAANLAAVDHFVRFQPDDVMVGVLPFFHSFGSTITLWAGLTRDVAVAYHHNPLEAKEIGELVRRTGATILPATPIFLRSYLRRCPPHDFRTLKVVPVGGERLPMDLSDEVMAAFGVRPLEGYGTTEMAPLVSANVPAGRAGGEPTASYRQGTVGRVVPGVRAKVVDLESGIELGPNQRGMLLVTGPGLMKGYLGQPEATAEVIQDGWYVTGDVATIDGDGFITLVDRVSRFAKIAGEMIPFGPIDAALLAVCGADEAGLPRAVVAAVPDPARGERLVVLHTELGRNPREVVGELADSGLSKLSLPAAADFFPVERLPVIGAGKLDLQGIKRLAEAAVEGPPISSGRRQDGPAPCTVELGRSVA